MTWSRQSNSTARRGYHHGNLREALIHAAVALITEKGPAGFAVAEAARLAGVSPAAPYRHFRDAEALLAEVARRGFEQLAEALETAWNDGRPEPVTAFEAVGRAYLRFARTQPAFYAAMFEARVPGMLIKNWRRRAIRRSPCCAVRSSDLSRSFRNRIGRRF